MYVCSYHGDTYISSWCVLFSLMEATVSQQEWCSEYMLYMYMCVCMYVCVVRNMYMLRIGNALVLHVILSDTVHVHVLNRPVRM